MFVNLRIFLIFKNNSSIFRRLVKSRTVHCPLVPFIYGPGKAEDKTPRIEEE